MVQTFGTFPSSEFVKDSRQDIEDRTEALRSSFGGVNAPTTPAPVKGQFWYEEDTDILWVCSNATGPVWSKVFQLSGLFLLLSGGALTGVLDLAKGANVASSATVNLDSATGNYLHITGTTGITAFTLGAGKHRVVCFDGVLNITAGANLIIQGRASGRVYTTRVGDVALLVGEGASVTRIVAIWRADGTPVAFGSLGIAIASAATVDLRDAGTDFVIISGTIGITAFTMNDGQQAEVVFLGALIITHASTLMCPQGVNFVTQNGTWIRLRKSGTDVHITGYMHNSTGFAERGKQVVTIGGEGILPRDTNGCAAPAGFFTTTNHVGEYGCAFDGTAREHGCIRVPMPPSWDGGTVELRYRWSNASGSGDVIWGGQALARGDDDAIDTAFGTAVEVTDSVTSAGDIMISAWSGAITPSGSPTSVRGKTLYLQIYRGADLGGDTLNGIDAILRSVDIRYTTNIGNDNA